jgi:hypothetical protein
LTNTRPRAPAAGHLRVQYNTHSIGGRARLCKPGASPKSARPMPSAAQLAYGADVSDVIAAALDADPVTVAAVARGPADRLDHHRVVPPGAPHRDTFTQVGAPVHSHSHRGRTPSRRCDRGVTQVRSMSPLRRSEAGAHETAGWHHGGVTGFGIWAIVEWARKGAALVAAIIATAAGVAQSGRPVSNVAPSM